MSSLDGFREKEFLDQITILNDIAGSGDVALLPELRDLFENPVGDASIHTMVVSALMGVLGAHEEATVQGLSSDDPAFQLLCIRASREHAFKGAAAPLAKMAQDESDPDRLLEILTALARIEDPACMEIFRPLMDSDDPLVAALSIEMAGRYKDQQSQSVLMDVVRANAEPDRFEVCEVTTWKAVEALAAMGGDEPLAFLAENLHHKNPTARRVITDCLSARGEEAVPHLMRAFNQGDEDLKILAANVLGFIGHKAGADGLVAAYDKGLAEEPNVRYAVYEALGRIGTLKGLVCLVDGLDEDEIILMAVIGGLERHVNPGVVVKLKEVFAAGGDQAGRLARAVASSRAVRIFTVLYPDPQVGEELMASVTASKDPDTLSDFRQALKGLAEGEAGQRAQADLERMPDPGAVDKAFQGVALAADDSRSMLALHRALLADMGFSAKLAANGQEALALAEESYAKNEPPALVVTDMNMPVMDGMEFVEKFRALPGFESVPVIMVTTESESTQRDLAAKVGVNAFVTKPFRPETLKEAVANLLK